MYDIVFVDIPYINYVSNDELEKQILIYRNQCDYIMKQRTGIEVKEKKLYYSMGILCLSSYLKASLNNIKVGYIHYYINLDDFEDFVKNTSILAFSTMTVTMNMILDMAKKAYKINPNIKIILGGYHASYFAKEILEKYQYIDSVFLCEGERALLEYMRNSRKESILGIAFRDETGSIICNDLKKTINSNTIPTPDYSLIEGKLQDFNIQLSTMRGCIGSCNFCVNKSYWATPRLIPIEMIVNELLYLKKYLTEGTIIHIIDNNFTYDKCRLYQLYSSMKNEGVLGYFKFECDTLSTLIDVETIKLLELIGVVKICLGIEDCNDLILKKSKKNVTFYENIEAAKAIKENSSNICVYAYWIIGLPGSTIETLEENIFQMQNLILNDVIDIISPKIFIPYPGTEFFNNAEKYGINIMSYNWDLYERRNPPFPYQYRDLDDKTLYNYLIKAFETCCRANIKKYMLCGERKW